ncbi:MAG: 16S rRNA (cytosine(1402)-N(4))-methyltransferase RsmH [Myxococcales bacterium]|nr:16S rRNA (cytosine(1402)-N(4))-methyltransferase RsmH [Myxococcales bacterium]MDH5567249.1 16S rRNA (cytosine(1402)-N(4))-methyltransferase RsmH [Myxococcales bacterium]
MASHFTHQPVLLEESLSWLQPDGDSLFVDGTVGGGGHAEALLERSAPSGRLIALDIDAEALQAAAKRLAPYGERVQLVHGSFRNLGALLRDLGVARVDGVLLDLGVSSHQLDVPERGFRFAEASAEGTPLDMRMDRQSEDASAADLLSRASESELAGWFRAYGDLRGARRLARAIVRVRAQRPLETARDLLEVIHTEKIGLGRRHNPATRVFQALRIAVNDELRALDEGLSSSIDALRPGGRLVVIAYHSAEDRIVKCRFRDAARGCVCPPVVPVCVCGGEVTLRVLTRRPITPKPDEIRRNPRARSARLRAAERVSEAA